LVKKGEKKDTGEWKKIKGTGEVFLFFDGEKDTTRRSAMGGG